MTTIQQYISVIGAFQGVLLFVLLVTDFKVSNAGRLLGFFCLFLALLFCLPFIMVKGPSGPFFGLIGWVFYLSASMGGIGYLYCRNSILNKKMHLRDIVHFSPLLICYFLTADYLVFHPEQLAMWIQGAEAKTWRLVLSEYIIFAQAFFYIAITLLLILRYRRQAKDELANFNPTIFKWLLGFILLEIPIWSLKAFSALSDSTSVIVFYISDIMIVLLIYFIAMAQWRHPQLFTVYQHGKEPRDVNKEASEADSGTLDPETRALLFDTVKQQVESRSLYLDSELTLAGLADTTGLSPHHLSEVLNQHEGKNFYRFINGYRVDYVCKKFKENSVHKILDIAIEAGFASKSTFNPIFKQFTGLTPSQYREGLKSNSKNV